MRITPSIFIGHGSPATALEKGNFQSDIVKYARSLENISSILVVSAHWEENMPLQITFAEKHDLIYDFYGFPDELYQLTYEVLGKPSLAKRIADSLNSEGIEAQLNTNRGLDHGTWIPLFIMYSAATIPVVQLSIPIPRTPNSLYEIGRALRHLRKENVLLIGSGNLIHNLAYVMYQVRIGKIDYNNFPSSPVEDWAQEVDYWIKDKLTNFEVKDLLNSPTKIPNFKKIAPTTEHFDPMYFILGTAIPNDSVNHFHESIHAGSISMRCFAFESP